MIKSRAKQLIQPMAHQRLSLAHDATTPVVFDCSDPGTGKTAVRIWAFAERRRKRGGCLLVLAPRTLLRTAWANDFAKFAPDMKISVATAANRDKAFAADTDVYITNHDAAKWLAEQKPAFFAKFSELVNDESTAFKHHTSQRSRAAAKIRKHFAHVANLTATPTSNGICDVWHQAFLLDGGARLGKSFYAFRDHACTPTQVGRNVNAVQWEDKPGAEEVVFQLLSEIVVRHKFEDCVDIPATHTYSLDYQLSPKQRKTYDDMEQAQLLFLRGGGGKKPALTAVNAAAVATKLLQIASGAVYDNDSTAHVVDAGRYELILDLAEQRKHPLVFFFWQHQRDLLVAEATRRKMSYGVLDGGANDTQRHMLVQAYQRGEYDVLFAHPQTAAHGLTLTRGTSTIWSGPTYNLEWWKQGNRRQARIGQAEKTEIIVVLAEDTIEHKVYDLLTGKDARMSNLLDLFSAMTSDFDLAEVA